MAINSEHTRARRNPAPNENRPGAGTHGAETWLNPTAGIKKNTALEVLLSRFGSHGLGDIDKANLMHRVDTKYLLPISALKPLLPLLAPAYTILEIGGARLFSYQNTYYDTSGMKFYRMHHNGKKDRFKIRLRRYLDSGNQYVEVKHKTNKSVTHKDRVLFNNGHGDRKRIHELVSMPFETNRPPLFESLVCSYQRIALADEENGERVSLDLNLAFRDPVRSRAEPAHHVLIAEVKRESRKAPSVFGSLMERIRHKPVSFSKYCIGCAQIHSSRIKTNRFKPTLMALDRLALQEATIAA